MLVSFLSICYNGMQSTVFRRKFRGASPYKGDLEDMGKVSAFLKRKNVLFSAKRYGIDAMGAMAQGLFASLLIGTIIKTLGQQLTVQFLIDAGNFAQQVAGPAMAVSIGAALSAPQLVLYSLIAVGMAANQLGGAGGPLRSTSSRLSRPNAAKSSARRRRWIFSSPRRSRFLSALGCPCCVRPRLARLPARSAISSSGQRTSSRC